MTKKVELYEIAQIDDGYGGKSVGNDTVKRTFWAKVTETNGGRQSDAGAAVLIKQYTLNAYNNKSAEVANGNYIKVDNLDLTVTGVVKKFNDREIEITAELRIE